jgi:hypothetical protein
MTFITADSDERVEKPALSEVERASSQRFEAWVALRRISSKVERVVFNALAK